LSSSVLPRRRGQPSTTMRVGLAAGVHLDRREDHPKTCGRAAPMRSFIISIEPSV
jgi:hypothetical protein